MPFQRIRRSGRVSKQVPITLFGSDSRGTVFSEDTNTVMLSLHGAGIVSRHTLIAEQELTMRSRESNREAEIRVVGEIGFDSQLHTYGVAFRDEHLDFWQVEFPALPVSPERIEHLHLECSNCHAPITIEHGDYEFDVCAIHGGLVRFCDQCAFATVWKFATEKRTSKPASFKPAKPEHLVERIETPVAVLELPRPDGFQTSAESMEAMGSFLAMPVTDRRIRSRAKVNYYACVRSEAFGDDIVACLDMSRGGLSFKTRKAYLVTTLVHLAVPFSRENPEAPAIFVAARIASLLRIPNGEFFRCGVAFLPLKS